MNTQELTEWMKTQLAEVEAAIKQRYAQLEASDPTLIMLNTSRANLLNIIKLAEQPEKQ